MSDLALITIDRGAMQASFTEQALAIRDNALESAALVGKVSNPAENEAANAAIQKLATFRRQITKAHAEAKRPVIDFGKLLDEKKAKLLAEVEAEEKRLGQLAGDFQALLEEQRQARERAARLEQERIAREAQEAIRQAAREEAERNAKIAREQAEAERMAREATNAIAREEAERLRISAESARAQSEAKSLEEMDAIKTRAVEAQLAVESAPKPEPVRAAGQVVTKDWEVTVADIYLLARAHPGCVKITPLIGEIKTLLKAGVKVAGVNAKQITVAGARSARVGDAIPV